MPRRFHLLTSFVALILAGLFAQGEAAADPKNGKTQAGDPKTGITLSVWKKEKASPGFTIYPQEGTAQVYLLDMNGEPLHSWHMDGERVRLLSNCDVLAIHSTRWGKHVEPWKSLKNHLIRYSWDGKKVWEYKASNVVHHDAHLLPNGNYIFLLRDMLPGSLLTRTPFARLPKVRSDAVQEVSPDKRIVYEWRAHSALDLERCGRWDCEDVMNQRSPDDPLNDWTHMNTVSVLPDNKWWRAGDARFKPGNFLVMPRNWSTVFLINRDDGSVVWSYQGDYRGGLGGGHEPHMIPDGLPGAGNILIFDNGAHVHPKESFILEVNPSANKLEWVYDAGKAFFSKASGSVQRLPNGNTLISEDNSGRVFEVTPEKEIVWEIDSPHEVNRASRIGYDACPQVAEIAVKRGYKKPE